ncbi:MAG: hypothetical protein KAG66_18485, partial [Methylococcales bacterium]|nr:hypothetical protein [Methylococcales bacterium]
MGKTSHVSRMDAFYGLHKAGVLGNYPLNVDRAYTNVHYWCFQNCRVLIYTAVEQFSYHDHR